jgi:hypothetical protein
VVEFVGICPERLAVVMRFMPNGSLQYLLYIATAEKAAAAAKSAMRATLPRE